MRDSTHNVHSLRKLDQLLAKNYNSPDLVSEGKISRILPFMPVE